MILSGKSIRECWLDGSIQITPFNESHINPASYDVTLGDEVLEYTGDILDAREQNATKKTKIGQHGFIVRPGRLYLMHTLEVVFTNDFVPVLDGKSSIGRLGILIHVTAGYGDPGFCGQYTLEVTSVAHSVRLWAGMRIGQMRFHHLNGAGKLYEGNYTGHAAVGPVASKSWKQFGGTDG